MSRRGNKSTTKTIKILFFCAEFCLINALGCLPTFNECSFRVTQSSVIDMKKMIEVMETQVR